uniref:Uncharacterized protein n=1 Tax=Eutreptiella gymnastica TaxID=73025 RepID=A0A7S1IQJ2_9EUGL
MRKHVLRPATLNSRTSEIRVDSVQGSLPGGGSVGRSADHTPFCRPSQTLQRGSALVVTLGAICEQFEPPSMEMDEEYCRRPERVTAFRLVVLSKRFSHIADELSHAG